MSEEGRGAQIREGRFRQSRGLSIRQVAAVLHITPSAVVEAEARAMAKLRKAFRSLLQ